MIVKQGESRQDTITSGTFGGILLDIHLLAAAVNNPLAPSDWNPASIQLKVLLKRNKQTHIILQDNLQLLGLFNTILKNQFEFFNGVDITSAAGGIKNSKLHSAYIEFGGPIRVNPTDQLFIEISLANSGTFGAAVDAAASYVEFQAMPTIGYEHGIYSTIFEVVQANTTKQGFSPGDFVTDLVLLNLDKNDLNAQVVANLNLSSDRLDLNLNFHQLLATHRRQFPGSANLRYGSTLPISASDPAGRAFRGHDQYPQTFILLGGNSDLGRSEVKQCRLDISFNSANVASSMNYVAYRRFQTSAETIAALEYRAKKHYAEGVRDLPSTI